MGFNALPILPLLTLVSSIKAFLWAAQCSCAVMLCNLNLVHEVVFQVPRAKGLFLCFWHTTQTSPHLVHSLASALFLYFTLETLACLVQISELSELFVFLDFLSIPIPLTFLMFLSLVIIGLAWMCNVQQESWPFSSRHNSAPATRW